MIGVKIRATDDLLQALQKVVFLWHKSLRVHESLPLTFSCCENIPQKTVA